MTADEFEAMYAANSKKTVEYLRKFRVLLPCACGEEGCHGWAMVSNDTVSIEAHKRLYAPKG